MEKAHSIYELIRQKGRITLPEIQRDLSLPYKTVREAITLLEGKRAVALDGGMFVRYLPPESEDDPHKNESLGPEFEEKRSQILKMMKEDDLTERIILYCAENGLYGKRLTNDALRRAFRLGFARVYYAMDRLGMAGVLSRGGFFMLTEKQCQNLLGNKFPGQCSTEGNGSEDREPPRFERADVVMERMKRFGDATKSAETPRPRPEETDTPFHFAEWLRKKDAQALEREARDPFDEDEAEEDISKEIRNASHSREEAASEISEALLKRIEDCKKAMEEAKAKVKAAETKSFLDETPLERIAKEQSAEVKSKERTDRLRAPLNAGADRKKRKKSDATLPPTGQEEGAEDGRLLRKRKKKK